MTRIADPRATENFGWSELTMGRVDTSTPEGLEAHFNLLATTASCVQRIRQRFGPFRVTSGYRTPAANSAAGGAPRSDHQWGKALDLMPLKQVDLIEVLHFAVDENLPFDQFILEHWDERGEPQVIHVSHERHGGNKRNVLVQSATDLSDYTTVGWAVQPGWRLPT